MTDTTRHALCDLAVRTAVHVERAPGPAEKPLILINGFAQAHRLNEAVTEDPESVLLNELLQQPDRLVEILQEWWTKGA